MNNQNICVYCNKTFVTKSNLNTHQKTVKSCKSNIEKTVYECKYCQKNFATTKNLIYHHNICDIKKEIDDKLQAEMKNTENKRIIEEELCKYKKESEEKYIVALRESEKTHSDQIKELEKSFQVEREILLETINNFKMTNKVLETRLEDTIKSSEILLEEYRRQIDFLQSKGCSTTNNTTNTTHIHGDKNVIFNAYFTPEFLSEGMKDYDENLVCHGMPGLAAYVKEKFLKKDGKLIYTCTDAARQHFKFTYDGKEINDKTATMLVQSLKPALTKQLKYINTQLNNTEDKLESIPKSDRTEEEKTKLDVTKHIITNKLTPLTIDVRELDTNHKLSLELSRLV